MALDSLTIAAAARPHPHESISGDAWTVHTTAEGVYRLALIDGLGHGPQAHDAALKAIQTLDSAPDLPPDRALALCHRALAGTRGAALSIVLIEPGVGQLTFAGIGNVEGRLWQPEGERRLLAQRGIVGAAAPTIRPVSYPLSANWLLILHSDGISDRFASVGLPGWGGPPQPLADAILLHYSRASDDATVMLVSPTSPGDA
jgi:serine phosphatase RsbU (regulator of sigma subunit)